MRVLIVDGANVIGSRPDGWWRDRPGAAARLHHALAQRELGFDLVVLVLEGAARRGRPPGQDGSVLTVHAAAAGDDAVVEEVRRRSEADEVVVATSDRELRERVVAAAGSCVGPSWLLARIE